MRDDGQVRCDPGKCLVLRREVMKVSDRSLRSPALRKEPLPSGDLSLGLSIVERREESVGRAHTILERWMERDLSGHRVALRSNASSAGVKSAAATSSPAKNVAALATAPGWPSDPVKSRTGQPCVEGCGEIAGDLCRSAARIEEQPIVTGFPRPGSISRASVGVRCRGRLGCVAYGRRIDRWQLPIISIDPDVVEKFHFTREVIEGPVYRKYEKAIRKFWSVEDLDFTQDARDWETIDDEQRRGLLGVTVRFLAGEQNVTNELVPMLAAAQALNRFDWTVYLSTFLMEEAKHAEFFMRWHDKVVGVLEPEEVAQHFLVRGKTSTRAGASRCATSSRGAALLRPQAAGDDAWRGRRPRSSAPSSRSPPPTTPSWKASSRCPRTRSSSTRPRAGMPSRHCGQGFRLILMDEGRHITFGTYACKLLIEKDPSYEEEVHRVFDKLPRKHRRPGRVSKAVPGLDLTSTR
jgi:ribonucleoside-diphosphate reductase beta chain